MPSFYTGDELGNIKRISCFENALAGKEPLGENRWKLEDRIVLKANNSTESTTKDSYIQKLACTELLGNTVLSIARANGSVQIVSPHNDAGDLKIRREWCAKEPGNRQRFVGMSLTSRGAFWCTSNGVLSFAKPPGDGSEIFSEEPLRGILPIGLRSWMLSSDSSSFCYGGTEVDLSVWDSARAFTKESQSTRPSSDGRKRNRGTELLPAEIWRAKNLPNDNLNLRQLIDITSITYLPSTSTHASGNGIHLVTGTQLGDVRRYDTRAARKPIAHWIGLGKVGGVGNVKAGQREHELFVSDNGSSLSAVDLRNGRVVYSYKQIQGAISDLVPSADHLASTSQDRFFRLHSTVSPPHVAGQQQAERGEVLNSLYMKSIPTVVVADVSNDTSRSADPSHPGEGEEDPWEKMQDISDDEDKEKPRKIRRSKE